MNSSLRPTWRTHYALGVLAAIYVFNYIDRLLMAILIEPVKAEFGISDTGRHFRGVLHRVRLSAGAFV